MCIANGKNKNLSPAAKRLLEWNFRFGQRNLRDTQIILWSPTFGADKIFSYSLIPFDQRPKCEVCQYEK